MTSSKAPKAVIKTLDITTWLRGRSRDQTLHDTSWSSTKCLQVFKKILIEKPSHGRYPTWLLCRNIYPTTRIKPGDSPLKGKYISQYPFSREHLLLENQHHRIHVTCLNPLYIEGKGISLKIPWITRKHPHEREVTHYQSQTSGAHQKQHLPKWEKAAWQRLCRTRKKEILPLLGITFLKLCIASNTEYKMVLLMGYDWCHRCNLGFTLSPTKTNNLQEQSP